MVARRSMKLRVPTIAENAPSCGRRWSEISMNEKGLVANLLWLENSDYGTRNPKKRGLSIALWTQYVLDNYATVEEAAKALANPKYQIDTRTIVANGETLKANLHLAIADKTGDTAIVEYADGKPIVHHDRKYTVMTNDPILDQQIANLNNYDGLGGKKPLPGTTDAADRFVRGSYYLSKLPKPANYRQAGANLFSIMPWTWLRSPLSIISHLPVSLSQRVKYGALPK